MFFQILLTFLIIYLVIEIFIYIFFPRLLLKNEFDDSKLCTKDNDLGWKQKKNIKLQYFHRYLSNKKSKIILNNYGVLDIKNYKNKKKRFRIAIFADTFFCGFDFGYNTSFQKILNEYGDKKDLEFLFCFQKNYSTLQMFKFYNKYFKKLKPDLIIYIFNSNHPRRNITLHESFKNKIFTQKAFNFKSLKTIKGLLIKNKYDLAFLNNKNKIEFKKHLSQFSFRRIFYENLFLYSKIDDFFSRGKLRKYDDIFDIRTLEKNYKIDLKNYPYHWDIFRKIILKWKKEAEKNKSKFVICRNFVPYHYSLRYKNKDNLNHELGFKLSDLPEIKYLENMQKKFKINLFNFKKNPPHKEVFIHERYGYYNKDGINFYSKLLINVINKFI